MRVELLYNPRLLCERLALASQRRRRLQKLKNTVASKLKLGEINSLELLELIRNGPPTVIYDIGAHVGTWTLLAKAVFPKAEIHAFEPLERHVRGFVENTKGIECVHLHPVALGELKSNMTMKVASFSDASSLLEIGPQFAQDYHIRKISEEEVPVELLDEYVSRMRLPEPDLIKLDVQGYELQVLRGGFECLKKARGVISEVSFTEYYQKQCMFEDVVAFLAASGFRLHSLSVCTCLGKALDQTDALFLRQTECLN